MLTSLFARKEEKVKSRSFSLLIIHYNHYKNAGRWADLIRYKSMVLPYSGADIPSRLSNLHFSLAYETNCFIKPSLHKSNRRLSFSDLVASNRVKPCDIK